MSYEKTVWAERIEELDAIKMVWGKRIDVEEMRKAFSDVVAYLNRADAPQCVIVDVSSNPRFPIIDTVIHCLAGPFKHPMLNEWLVIGGNDGARTIGNMLMRVSGRANIKWFDDEAAFTAYCVEQKAERERLQSTVAMV